MKTEKKHIAYYVALPYTKTLRRDEDGDVVAKIAELPGCSAHGANEQEALQNLEEAQRLWLEDCIAAGDAVPEPEKETPLPSGKWVQRVPRSLHRKLAMTAKDEGVSLNQLVTSMLSQAVSTRAIEKATQPYEKVFQWMLANVPFQRPQLKHYWDTAMPLEWGNLPVLGRSVSVGHWTNLGNLIPTTLKLKVENADETQENRACWR